MCAFLFFSFRPFECHFLRLFFHAFLRLPADATGTSLCPEEGVRTSWRNATVRCSRKRKRRRRNITFSLSLHYPTKKHCTKHAHVRWSGYFFKIFLLPPPPLSFLTSVSFFHPPLPDQHAPRCFSPIRSGDQEWTLCDDCETDYSTCCQNRHDLAAMVRQGEAELPLCMSRLKRERNRGGRGRTATWRVPARERERESCHFSGFRYR